MKYSYNYVSCFSDSDSIFPQNPSRIVCESDRSIHVMSNFFIMMRQFFSMHYLMH